MSTTGCAVAVGVGVGSGSAVGVGASVAATSPVLGVSSEAIPTPLTPVTTKPSSVTFAGLSTGFDTEDDTAQVTTIAATATMAMTTAESVAPRITRARD